MPSSFAIDLQKRFVEETAQRVDEFYKDAIVYENELVEANDPSARRILLGRLLHSHRMAITLEQTLKDARTDLYRMIAEEHKKSLEKKPFFRR